MKVRGVYGGILHVLFVLLLFSIQWSTLSLKDSDTGISFGIGQFQAITKIVTPDHEDPNYTDVCYEITREMCDFCCLVDFEFCSRDIGICEPVTDRHIAIIVHCAYVFAGVLVGFPIIINCLKCFVSFRMCK